MNNSNINALDVVKFLSQDQGDLREHLIETATAQWEADAEGLAFFEITARLSLSPEKANWKKFFEAIELVLSEPNYSKYSDAIKTHILEGFSNMVANGSLDAKILKENAGFQARSHIKRWEIAMDGKSIF